MDLIELVKQGMDALDRIADTSEFEENVANCDEVREIINSLEARIDKLEGELNIARALLMDASQLDEMPILTAVRCARILAHQARAFFAQAQVMGE